MSGSSALGVRTRFEVFKRDAFTCQYCGRKSPDVVLQVDHIVPRADGGLNDVINLTTSCWECNHGKSDHPLNEIVTGEDPHDRAILLLEKERQLREYNAVVAAEHERREGETWTLVKYWKSELGYEGDELMTINNHDYRWLLNALLWCPMEIIRQYMDAALARNMTKNLKYVAGCCRNWRYEHAANQDTRGPGSDY
jgi:HNH endonuclease